MLYVYAGPSHRIRKMLSKVCWMSRQLNADTASRIPVLHVADWCGHGNWRAHRVLHTLTLGQNEKLTLHTTIIKRN